MADYARQHHLDKKRFYNWKWILANRGLLEADIEAVAFAQVKLDQSHHSQDGVIVQFPNGCRLMLGELSAAQLLTIVQTLAQS